MRNRLTRISKIVLYITAISLAAIFLSGCPSGGSGGGGGTVTPPNGEIVHHSVTSTEANIVELGKSYRVSVSVKETRGDEIVINKLRTYRTLTTNGNNDTDLSAKYYDDGATFVQGWMLVPGSEAVIANNSSLGNYNQHSLKGYETKTISTNVMIGREFENKPTSFDGIFISHKEFKDLIQQGKIGVKYWIVQVGYDHKLNDNYNILMPLVITFNTNPNPVHTTFSSTPAQINALGESYNVSVSVQETRGDEVSINKLRTYRTLTTNGNYDTEQSTYYYDAGASLVQGWMLVPGTTTVVQNISSLGSYNQHSLKGYETKTIRTSVMVGREFESKPASFNGIYIGFNEFKNWVLNGKVGVKYWVVHLGYDYKLNDNYNIFMPLEIQFNTSLINTTATPGTGPGTGGTGTNPYDISPTNPF